MTGKHYRRPQRHARNVIAATLIACSLTAGVGAWAISESTPAGAAPACLLPRHWAVRITYRPGYNAMYTHVCIADTPLLQIP